MVHLSTWVDLWDQSLGIIKHSESGVGVYKRLHKFLQEFGKLQTDTFIAQRKLCNKYLIDNEKVFGMENSYGDAFNEFIRTVHHAVEAESLISTAFGMQAEKDVKLSLKDEQTKLKKWKADRNKLFNEMKMQMRIMDDETRRYRDKYRDMIRANDEYLKIDADRSASRIDVDRVLQTANEKKSEFERARSDYSAALNQFNIYRQGYFMRVLPAWFQAGYELTDIRYNRTRQLFTVLHKRIKVASDQMDLVARELEETCSNYLLLEKDATTMVEKLRSGYPPPGDIAFVDLTTPTSVTPHASNNGYGAAAVSDGSCKTSTSSTRDGDDVSGQIYASTSLPLPPGFHGSVSAADAASIEAAGLPPPGTLEGSAVSSPDAAIYAALVGNASLTIATATTTGATAYSTAGGQSHIYRKTLSRTSTLSGAIHSARSNLLNRLFSRRSKLLDSGELARLELQHHTPWQTGNSAGTELPESTGSSEFTLPWRRSLRKLTRRQMSFAWRSTPGNKADIDLRVVRSVSDLTSNTCNSMGDLDANVSSQLNTTGLPLTRQLVEDSSDFSDSSLHPDEEEEEEKQESAYAETDVLTGLPETDSRRFGYGAGSSNQPAAAYEPRQSHLAPPPTTTVPLARPESASSLNQGVANWRPLPEDGRAKRNGGASVEHNMSRMVSLSEKLTSQQSGCQAVESTSATAGEGGDSDEFPPANRSEKESAADAPRHFFPRQAKVRTSCTGDTAIVVGHCTAVYSFTADGFESCYFPFEVGDSFYILAPSPTEDTTDWLRVLHPHSHNEGFVPTTYVEEKRFPQPQILALQNCSTGETNDDYARLPTSSSLASNREHQQHRKSLASSKFSNMSSPLHRFPPGGLRHETEL